jgi:hypothetical protein
MKTLTDWLKRHSRIKVEMFERNYRKQSGSGRFEIVCGFCLSSHRFRSRHPRICAFCQAPIRATGSISVLPEVLNQRWRIVSPPKTPSLGKQSSIRNPRDSEWKRDILKPVPGRKLALMSSHENKCWVFAFCYWLDLRKTDQEADRLAWRDVQLEFPRLRKYYGCKP